MTKYLVTGGAGFIGRHVTRLLHDTGNEVWSIGRDRADFTPSQWGISHWVDGLVTESSLASLDVEFTCIVHCAGGSSVGASIQDPIGEFKRTIDSTIAVLEYARNRPKAPKFVALSSAGVYGARPPGPISVSADLDPVSPYGYYKKMSEDLCFAYGKQYKVPTAIVRLFSVYGAGIRKQLLWDACNKLALGKASFSGTGNETRDWLHVSDAAALLLLAAEKAAPRPFVLNGGTGVAIPIKSVVEHLARGLKLTPEITFNGQARDGDPVHFQADIAEASSLGWTPKVDWCQGVSEYAAWFQKEFENA